MLGEIFLTMTMGELNIYIYESRSDNGNGVVVAVSNALSDQTVPPDRQSLIYMRRMLANSADDLFNEVDMKVGSCCGWFWAKAQSPPLPRSRNAFL